MSAMTTEDSFWAGVQRGEPDNCWPHSNRPNRSGYVKISWHGQRMNAQVIARMLTDGLDPLGPRPQPMVLHSCHNRPCCNPGHLRWGTHQDNMDDRRSVGRYDYKGQHWTQTDKGKKAATLCGTNSFRAKLTLETVQHLREEASRWPPYAKARGRWVRQQARDLGVTASTVYLALSGRSYHNEQ